jgi:hypothetical protein
MTGLPAQHRRSISPTHRQPATKPAHGAVQPSALAAGGSEATQPYARAVDANTTAAAKTAHAGDRRIAAKELPVSNVAVSLPMEVPKAS